MQGDPTEGALIVLAAKLGVTARRWKDCTSGSRNSRSIRSASGCPCWSAIKAAGFVCTKGAPDLLMEQCAYVLWDGKVVPFTASLRQKAPEAAKKMAESALRVLGFAYRDLRPQDPTDSEADVEKQLVFVGLAGMIDPPRREVRDAIATCRQAGIKTVMITGDHQLTAEAIASQLGILPRGGRSLDGRQLEAMTRRAA